MGRWFESSRAHHVCPETLLLEVLLPLRGIRISPAGSRSAVASLTPANRLKFESSRAHQATPSDLRFRGPSPATRDQDFGSRLPEFPGIIRNRWHSASPVKRRSRGGCAT